LFALRPIAVQRVRGCVLATPHAGIMLDALTSGSGAKWQSSMPWRR
jgi:hypothetical protein